MQVIVNNKAHELTIVTSRYKKEQVSVRGRNRGMSLFLDEELLQSLIVSVYELDSLTKVLTLPKGSRTWFVDDLAHWLKATDTELVLLDRVPRNEKVSKGNAAWAAYEARELHLQLPAGCYDSFLSRIRYLLVSAPEKDGLPIYSLADYLT